MKLLTIQEVADFLKVSKSWVYAMTSGVSKNSIPYVKVGKYIRFEEAEVVEWVRKQRSQKQNSNEV
jgi:excisionase family DNA binding protein